MRQRCDNLVGFVRQQKLRDVERALLQNLQRGTDTAGNRELDQRLQFRSSFTFLREEKRDKLKNARLAVQEINNDFVVKNQN